MDKRLKSMMKELGDAINNSLSDSDQIAEVISRIKAGGYDVFVVLEATIGFNQHDEDESETTSVNSQHCSSALRNDHAGCEVPEVAAHQRGRCRMISLPTGLPPTSGRDLVRVLRCAFACGSASARQSAVPSLEINVTCPSRSIRSQDIIR